MGSLTNSGKLIEKIDGSVSVMNSTEPSNPAPGKIWYDTSAGKLKMYDGSSWIEIGGGGGTSLNPYGDGHDGDFTLTSGTCYLEAKEYDFSNFTLCGGTLRFYGQGVPVIRVCDTAKLCCGNICLNPTCNCAEWLGCDEDGVYYAWAGEHVNHAAKKEMIHRLTQDCMCRGGSGNGRGGDSGCAGCVNVFNGSNRCAGGAASGASGGGGGGYSAVGGAASSTTGGAGGCSTFSSVTYNSDCGRDYEPGSGGGGYGSTSGGAGGNLTISNITDNATYGGEYINAGYGGCGGTCGGNGGCLYITGGTHVKATAGSGGHGSCCGGEGGHVIIQGGTINSYNSTTDKGGAKYLCAGNGGNADRYPGDGGYICICGNVTIRGTSLYGGKGGDSYCGDGGRGGSIINRTTTQVITCDYVCPATYEYIRIQGGDGGMGRCGGAGGNVQFRCCNGDIDSMLIGGRGGDGINKGGDGGSVLAGCGITFHNQSLGSGCLALTGGDGGNAVGGMYNALLSARVLCSCDCASVRGSGGCGGKGGDITNCTTTLLLGRPGHGGHGSDGGNMSIIYGSCYGNDIHHYLCGGCGGMAGLVYGCVEEEGVENGLDGKDGELRVMRFSM